MSKKLILIKEKEINDKTTVKGLEKEIENVLKLLKEEKEMLKLNPDNFVNLIDLSKELEKEILDLYSYLNDYYINYKKSLKEKLNSFFSIEERDIFGLDFALPEIPKEITRTYIDLKNLNKDSKNLCVPILNLDSEGKNLICSYKSLELNLGQICPILYNKTYIINILSFINEELKLKIEGYNLENIINPQEKKEEKKENEEKEEEEKEDDEYPNGETSLISIKNDKINEYLTTKEFLKKGENIQLFVEIPQILDVENTIKITSNLNIESSSGKKLDLPVTIILSTIPISILISCNEYDLIKNENNEESMEKDEIDFFNSGKFRHYFKLDTNELLGEEEINFEILNYKEKEPIEFYLSAKYLKNNTYNIIEFSKDKQKNNFKIKIPKYQLNPDDKEIPKLHFFLEIFINKNFIIYIEIDAFVRPIFNKFKIYDFYSKTFVENQLEIYLNETTQKMFKQEKKGIELKCLLFV